MTSDESNDRYLSQVLSNISIPTTKSIDRFLIQHLPTYIQDERISTEKDMIDIKKVIETVDVEINELEEWHEKTELHLKKIMKALDALETGGGKA